MKENSMKEEDRWKLGAAILIAAGIAINAYFDKKK